MNDHDIYTNPAFGLAPADFAHLIDETRRSPSRDETGMGTLSRAIREMTAFYGISESDSLEMHARMLEAVEAALRKTNP